MNCRLCNSESLEPNEKDVLDFEYGSPGYYNYLKCRKCGLSNITPLPSSDILALAYPDTYHAYHSHHSLLGRFLKTKFWNKKAKRYSHYLDGDGRILDIGCAFGDLLAELESLGYKNLKGLEFNGKIAEKAQKRGLDVSKGGFDDFQFPAEKFQMIIMENFLEHVYDPLKTLQKCNGLLKMGDCVVGETPNTASWDKKLFGRHWGGYHAPRHLYLFDINSLSYIAEKTGFRVVRISNLLQPAHWALSVQNLLQDSRWNMELKRGRSFYFSSLLLMAIPINLMQAIFSETSLVEFVFEKVSDI